VPLVPAAVLAAGRLLGAAGASDVVDACVAVVAMGLMHARVVTVTPMTSRLS